MDPRNLWVNMPVWLSILLGSGLITYEVGNFSSFFASAFLDGL